MQLKLFAIGNSPNHWLKTGIADYQKRLPSYLHFQTQLIGSEKNDKNSSSRVIKEGNKLLQTSQSANTIIALDEKGKLISTAMLSTQLSRWQLQADNVAIIIGGADGLSAQCKNQANALWSLSKLTLPHHLARLLFIEQLYRACSILSGHPYHRQ